MMTKTEKYKKAKGERLRIKFLKSLMLHAVIVMAIMLYMAQVSASENNKIEGEDKIVVHESIIILDKQDATTPPANDPPAEIVEEEELIENVEKEEVFLRNISANDMTLLAKLAMAEAEGESLETKMKIIMVVLNRVESNDFPDTIEEVIFQKDKRGVYQFSPVIPGGRWWTTEPNEECWEAVNLVNELEYDVSCGALFFESCKGESWHSRNLTLISESDNTRFYK